MLRYAHRSCARKILPFLWVHVDQRKSHNPQTCPLTQYKQIKQSIDHTIQRIYIMFIRTYVRTHAIQWYSMWQYNANVPFCFHSVLWNNSTVLGRMYGPFCHTQYIGVIAEQNDSTGYWMIRHWWNGAHIRRSLEQAQLNLCRHCIHSLNHLKTQCSSRISEWTTGAFISPPFKNGSSVC